MNNCYKERNPKKTISIIEKFFKSKNIEIRQKSSYYSEINTYSCSYDLFFNNRRILSANGKGMTYEYSKASCYAELYERFCAYNLSFSNNFIFKKDIMKQRKEKYGYYLYPKEKELTTEEYIQQNIYMKKALQDILPENDNDSFHKFISIFSDNKKIGMPYQSLLSNKITYQDFHLIFRKIGTTGLASGNTIEEALVQGCSEVFERYVLQQLFSQPKTQYFLLNYKNSQINKLKKLGYKIYIYDLSYTFNLPVCCLIVVHPFHQTTYIKLGSFPVFEIALQRCLTELYQGLNQMDGNYTSNIELCAFDFNNSEEYIYESQQGLLNNKYTILPYPEFIFNNTIKIKNYNSQIFLNTKFYNNNQLLDQIKIICQKNNLNLNWLDISLSKQIHTVHIVPEEYILTCRTGLVTKIAKLDCNQKKQIINLSYKIYQYLLKNKQELIQFNEKFEQDFYNLLKNLQNTYNPLYYAGLLLGNNLYTIYFCKDFINIDNNYNSLIDILLLSQNKNQTIFFPIRDNRKKIWEQYQMFLLYKTKKYSSIKIQEIFNNLQLQNIDFEKYQNNIYFYLIYLIYIQNFYQLYNSQEYNKFLSIIA